MQEDRILLIANSWISKVSRKEYKNFFEGVWGGTLKYLYYVTCRKHLKVQTCDRHETPPHFQDEANFQKTSPLKLPLFSAYSGTEEGLQDYVFFSKVIYSICYPAYPLQNLIYRFIYQYQTVQNTQLRLILHIKG